MAGWRQFTGMLLFRDVLQDLNTWYRNRLMAEGTIKRVTDKGFGFIDTGGAKDLFFHSSALEGVRFDDLREGQRVSFEEGRGPKGPCAENVKVL
ncbi:Cold shock protein CspB [Rosistilla carotiformis]|nr:Cold shock protein CspB [Rosistilla carotiformis]